MPLVKKGRTKLLSLFFCNDPAALSLVGDRTVRFRITATDPDHAAICDRFFHLCLGISPLQVRLIKTAVPSVFFLYVDHQVVFVDLFFFIPGIFPDEASLSAVFGDHGIPDHIPVFVYGIEIQDQQPFRIQIVVHQLEDLCQFFFV